MRIGKVCHFPGRTGRRGPGDGHMFHVKHCRWRGRCSGCRVGLAGGVGGPGTGSGRVDAIGYRPGELHVGEARAVPAPRLVLIRLMGSRLSKGRLPTWGIAWPRTWIFTRRCVRTSSCGRPLRTVVSRCIPTSRLPGGNAGRIDFKTVPIELDPAHITRIDQAIKGR